MDLSFLVCNFASEIIKCNGNMTLTKEEALKRFKNAMNRKKEWEDKFDAKYADVKNLYAKA